MRAFSSNLKITVLNFQAFTEPFVLYSMWNMLTPNRHSTVRGQFSTLRYLFSSCISCSSSLNVAVANNFCEIVEIAILFKKKSQWSSTLNDEHRSLWNWSICVFLYLLPFEYLSFSKYSCRFSTDWIFRFGF